MTWLLPLCLLALAQLSQASTGCKNCIMLGKAERAMFRAHSEACLAQSGASPRAAAALLAGAGGGAGAGVGQGEGAAGEGRALRRHVYCVLLKCKLIGKDGKLQKNAVLGKMAARPDGKNVTKVLESCAQEAAGGHSASPEDVAWDLFRCGFDKKALLFDYMPTGGHTDDTQQ